MNHQQTSRMPSLWVIDDELGRLQTAEAACNKCPVFGNLVMRQVDTAERYLEVSRELAGDDNDKVVLLDLKLRSAGVGMWESVRNDLREIANAPGLQLNEREGKVELEYLTTDGSVTLPDVALDGLAFLWPLASNAGRGRCLVIVVTGQGGIPGLTNILDAVEAYALARFPRKPFRVKREAFGGDLSQQGSAGAVITRAASQWCQQFPDFHVDPQVDGVVREWLGCFRTLSSSGVAKSDFGSHGHIQANPRLYARVLASGLGQEEGIFLADTGGLKATFEIDKTFEFEESPIGAKKLPPASKRTPGDGNWPKSAFRAWDPRNHRFRGKPVAPEFLKVLLRTLSGLSVTVLGNPRLPVTPAMSFFLGLRMFFVELRNQEGGILDDGGQLTISAGDWGTCLSVPLKQSEGREFGLAKRWSEKVATGKLEDGVCGSLWMLLHAKVEVSKSSASDEAELKLLGILDGVDRPVFGVHFAPHFLHLFWN